MSHNYSKISSKGQITIPSVIRKKLHLLSGNKLEFILQDNNILMIPINNTVSKLKGLLPKPKLAITCEEMNEVIKKSYDRN